MNIADSNRIRMQIARNGFMAKQGITWATHSGPDLTLLNPLQLAHAWRQPTELTTNKLVRLKNLPIVWADQREYPGFPAD